MKKLLLLLSLIPVATFAHETDNFHWLEYSKSDGETHYVQAEDLDRKQKAGLWFKDEKIESYGVYQKYYHLKADCKKYILVQDGARLKFTSFHPSIQSTDISNKNIRPFREDTYEQRMEKQNLINALCN